VRASNRAAIDLYERFGFRAAGRRRGYYHDNREDATIMWRTASGPKVAGTASSAGGRALEPDASPEGTEASPGALTRGARASV